MNKIIFMLAFLLAATSYAKMKEADLNQPAATAASAMLLTQAEILSTQFSQKSGVAYAPKMEGTRIKVTGTVIEARLLSNQRRLRSLVTRQVNSFTKVMDERVPMYVPTLTDTFKSSEDMYFVIVPLGSDQTIGTWDHGAWTWSDKPARMGAVAPGAGEEGSEAATGAGATKSAVSSEPDFTKGASSDSSAKSSGKPCDCPSLIRKKRP